MVSALTAVLWSCQPEVYTLRVCLPFPSPPEPVQQDGVIRSAGHGLTPSAAYASLGCRRGASRPYLEPGLVSDKADIEVPIC